MFTEMRRLHERGPHCRGLVVDTDGVMLGPDCVLVRRTARGFEAADSERLTGLTKSVFADDARLGRLPQVLASVARALDAGDLVKAQLLGLAIPIGKLDEAQLRRLRRAGDLAKDEASFDPDQPRDERGRWTTEGGSGQTSGVGIAGSTAASAATSVFAPELAESLGTLAARLVARLAGPVAALGYVFIPTNRTDFVSGTVEGRPDLSFSRDIEHILSITQTDANGIRTSLFEGRARPDGLYVAANGTVIGRDVGNSVVIDPDALAGAQAVATPAQGPREDDRADGIGPAVIGTGIGIGAGLRIQTDTARNEPKLCPDPGPDQPGNKSDIAIAYQQYVSTLVNSRPLPAGLAVSLFNPASGKDVHFDDCRLNDGTMIEAKGPGYLAMMLKKSEYPWKGAVDKMLDQAERQSQAAAGRRVEWHFAEKAVADYMRGEFEKKRYKVDVYYTPFPG